ncbi:MAG: hypothetical protein KJS92_08230 [Bacteroidetes bacterium]|nr:hypothetical protein [Bacteroidota bacterium]
MNNNVFKHNKPDFNPPEGYFDSFEQLLMNHIHQEEKTRSFSLYRTWRAFTAAACISALLLAAGWNLQRIMSPGVMKIQNNPESFAPMLIPDTETGLLNDEDLLDWIEQPVQVNLQHPNSQGSMASPSEHVLTTEDLIEAGLIEPEDPALNIEGIF